MLRKVVLTLFSFLWLFIIFAEYLFEHEWYKGAVENFQYYSFLVLLILGIGGIGFYLHKNKEKRSFKGFNGLTLFGLSFLISLTVTIIFFSKLDGASFTAKGGLHLAGMYLGGGLAVYLCIALTYLLGDLLLILFPLKLHPRESFLIKIAFGMMLVVGLLFLLGIADLLYPIVLIPVFLGLSFLNLQAGKTFVETTLLKPIPLSADFNVIGVAAFAVLLSFITLNYTSVLRPIPIGFDAMTVYMRLPSLIGDYHGLVAGNGFYNYSLFMSLGYVVFDSTMVTLCLSFVGGPLALFAFYALCRRWMNANLAFVALACFYVMPEISYLSFQDMKIDLGLLFISICVILLLVNWITPYKPAEGAVSKGAEKSVKTGPQQGKSKSKSKSKKASTRKKKAQKKTPKTPAWLKTPAFILRFRDWVSAKSPAFLKEYPFMIAMGVLTGFAFGIKLTSIMLLMGLFVVIWYVKGNLWTTLGVTFLCFFGVLLLGFDRQSGLRELHAAAGIIQWTLAAVGLALLGWQAVKDTKLVMVNMKRSLVVVSFFVLMLIPWLGKNVIEAKSLNRQAILNGQDAMEDMDFPTAEEVTKYENQNR